MKLAVALLAGVFSMILLQKAAVASDTVGVRQIAAPSEERGINLDATVWYPAQPGGESVTLGDSLFFAGTPAMRDAPIIDGIFPLILLSHGAGLAGNPQAISWMAAALAQQGFMVAAPQHPGNSGVNRSAAETMKIWLRPADVTATLNAIEKNAFFKDHVDKDKIGVLGLSMGGGTALAIAGARLDPKLLAGYCDTDTRNASLCGWVRASGVDLHAIDMRSAGLDNRDKRIRFAMAIDPAPVDTFDFDSFSKISIPVDLINLGEPDKIPPTVNASGLAKAIHGSRYAVIEDANHFSMFAECKPGASELAEFQEIGDPVCRDAGRRPRSAIHAQLIGLTADAFRNALGAGQ
jgi:predicted dienelactone hydrolase